VVSFGPPTPAVRAAVAAMTDFPKTDAGKKVLERMTLRGFRAATASDYASLLTTYDQARKELSR
jgi:ABC-type phosphate/phosphonate transport system substrate-binding protein